MFGIGETRWLPCLVFIGQPHLHLRVAWSGEHPVENDLQRVKGFSAISGCRASRTKAYTGCIALELGNELWI